MRTMTRALCAALMMASGGAASAESYGTTVRLIQRDGDTTVSDGGFTSTKDELVERQLTGATVSTMSGVAGQDFAKIYAQSQGVATGDVTLPMGTNNYGTSSWSHDVTAQTSATVKLNAFYDVAVGLVDPVDFATRVSNVDFNSAGLNAIQYDNSATVFGMAAYGHVVLRLADLTVGGYQDMFIEFAVTRTVQVRRDGPGEAWTINPFFTGEEAYGYKQVYGSPQVYGQYGYGYEPLSLPANGHVADNFGFFADVTAGHSYTLSMEVYCSTSISTFNQGIGGTSATCDAAHSAYWNGVTDAPAGFTLAEPNGQNFVYSSSLSPAPLVVPGGVPEPAEWALMLGGFGLLGAAVRRRKAVVTA